MQTRVFHIVFFDYDSSAYIHFFDCNFKCKGCLRKLSIWDCHLPSDVISRLKLQRFLSLHDLQSVLENLISNRNMKKAILGGGEPTTDPTLVEILKILKRLNLNTVLLTNAYRINSDLMKELTNPEVTVVVSVKSIDPVKHKMYTGFSPEPVLNNIVEMYYSNVKLAVETINIPGLNDAHEIGQLASFVASIDKKIPLIIDSFIPVPGTRWRRSTLNELERAEKIASTYLENVYLRGKTISEGIKGGVYLIYPQLQDFTSSSHD